MRKVLDERAVELWEVELFSLQMIGDVFGVTRQAVRKYLRKAGIDTGKRKWDAICAQCGGMFKIHRSRLRRARKVYCSEGCYIESMRNPAYNESRQGQRVARALVKSTGFLIGPECVVHHVDGDCDNNDIENLIVFGSQADHMRWHRGDRGLVEPLWVGK